MSGRNSRIAAAGVLAASLLAASFTAVFLADCLNRAYFQMLGDICREIAICQPGAEQAFLSALKEVRYLSAGSAEENILLAYGYHQSDFYQSADGYSAVCAAAGFLAGGILFLVTLLFWRKREIAEIQNLTDYLEKVNMGQKGLLFQVGEDAFSRLQDEMYKTVTALYQTRDAAVNARNNFAENLSNIAHQLKTPITSILLSVQILREKHSPKHLEQISRQLSHLTDLEEALLLLARIDAGTLSLDRKKVDVFTVLMLAADNLQELAEKAGISVDIPEAEEMGIYVDMDWTMEALMNLMKNCMEHTPPGGTVHCDYEQNPLYTQIKIWDTGTGFSREDLPHLFERFYRGKNAGHNGVGIGLALSKAIIESQNGTISAGNLPEAGACFEIRIYSH